jgi:uncharacterized protein DUF6412
MSMGSPARRVASLWGLAVVGLVVASAAAGLVGDSGLAAPLVVSSVLLLALAVAVAARVQQVPAVASGGPVRRHAESPHPVRQCDPNAAGHARPRAPSRIASGCR